MNDRCVLTERVRIVLETRRLRVEQPQEPRGHWPGRHERWVLVDANCRRTDPGAVEALKMQILRTMASVLQEAGIKSPPRNTIFATLNLVIDQSYLVQEL